ncbi:MAG: putative 4-hydroxybenzoate polyprenyltransferase [Verrucomicrobiota bacterium]|nr:putative 4-hydroxybenzoate polyprenyltransferase [Verrucomicrobiota bacterium]
MFSALVKWSSFVKLSHTVFALPFALASMVVAARDNRGWPGWKPFLLVLAALVSARTCAMAFNRIVDREFDKKNPRTASRHLPRGEISLASAWLLCLLSGAGLVIASVFLNRICFYLSPVALFFVCFYSLTKRFTDFTHVFLGIALALAPIGAWLAVRGEIIFWPMRESFFLPLLLAVAVVFWLIGFDLIYAIQDYDFDVANNLGSLVVRWGMSNALSAAFLAHMLMAGVLLMFGLLSGFKLAYFIGMLIITFCLVLEHWLARRRSLNWINNSFFRLNALISVIFLVVTVTEVVFPFFKMR